ncbi:MAG: thiamine pyrophosphate-binding protein [Chthoniobacteraceae bacterium]
MEIRLADYIVQRLADYGVRHIFMVTGGGAMHLNDAIGREPRIQYICSHHEQASAMGAEGYARVSNKIGVVNVTAGPGGVNALNGVFGAFTDSIPMLVLSGQVKRETNLSTHGLLGKLRQFGDQEIDIVGMVKNITKYAVTINDPNSIRYHLERALHLATSGRPGPCWLDVPVDVQGSKIDPGKLAPYDPAEDVVDSDESRLATICREIVEKIASAKRPVIMAGSGVRIAGAVDLFQRVTAKLGIPVTTAWTHDTIATDNPLFCGRPGSIGDRPGNFTVQNSDLLLVIGSRLNIRQVSYNWDFFARHAYKIQVDVDREELKKPMVTIDLPVCSDAHVFLEELERQLDGYKQAVEHASWLAWCRERKQRYPVFQPEKQISKGDSINPYHFAKILFEELAADDVIACGDATACIVTFQSADIQLGQRLFSNSGAASMGHDLPAAIGAAVAREGRRVICLAGDGSLQMNIQELQTVAKHRWPVKIFVLSNGGYLSIRQTQANFFGLQVGATPESGVSFPDHVKLAQAYGLNATRLDRADFVEELRRVLASPDPEVCEVVLDRDQSFEPKLTSRRLPDGRMVSSPLEDMAPFLSREELAENMIVPILQS